MKLLALDCRHCGAPLEVPLGASRVRCEYCTSQLEIRDDDRAPPEEETETDGDLDPPACDHGELADGEIDREQLLRDLTQLDRRWRAERGRFVGHGSQMNVPTKDRALAVGAIGTCCGLLLAFVGGSYHGPVAVIMGLIVIGVALLLGYNSMEEAAKYEARRQVYRMRRASLLRWLQENPQSSEDAAAEP